MNTPHREKLERLLAEAYDLKIEIESDILVSGDPVERAKLKRQLETCNANIKRYKADLDATEAAPPPPAPSGKLNDASRRELEKLLKASANFGSPITRSYIVNALPLSIRQQLPNPLGLPDQIYIKEVIKTCERFPGGLKSLIEEIIETDDGAQSALDLEAFARQHNLL